jgi:hypothetical protein
MELGPVLQLLKNFPAFYGTRRFITVFTRALHWSLSWTRSIHSIPPRSTSLRSILLLPTHLHLGISSGLFPSGFPTSILYAFLSFPFVLRALPILYSLTWSFWLYLARSTSNESPHYAVYFNLPSLIPLRSKYSPQHPVLKHPQSVFLF